MSLNQEITRHIVDEYLPGTPPEELADSYDLLRNGVVSSLQLLRLIAWLGNHYDVPFDELDVTPDDFRSVAAIAGLIDRHRRSVGTSSIPAN
ncbi:phosphopantetheine-binding protein [Streptomyces griseofuscus]|uniref:phosphopantetheine-binding protein n=1 Tax=Streptomyces TaxID=1883 RepID=UPI00081D4372|nr:MULTISPECIES: phosphopantetheine-binding protein [unclassified Streptomyces]MBJ6999647.1 acyl carrier protein [Streptomyces sp. CRPSP2-6A1]MYQ96464.1 acyl carrier protein [Streptomyces sp. SID4946]SCG00693.1 Phosphopantetheine attachment site [Streptomyces sp. DconLS]SCG03494.1 Phosphopantetheine attachment site [Streptomyces sp. LamerLS-31b]